MARVVIFGNSSQAEQVHHYLTTDSPHEVVAFTVDRAVWERAERTFHGLPVVPFDDLEARYPPGACQLVLPIAYRKMNHIRAAKFAEARGRGYEMASYVSSRAYVWAGFEPGENCFVYPNATIAPYARLGDDCVVGPNAAVCHHAVVGDHVWISAQAVICGGCTVEDFCFVGANATVRDETVLARETLVGAGAVIMADTRPFEVYIAAATRPAGIRSDELRSIAHKS